MVGVDWRTEAEPGPASVGLSLVSGVQVCAHPLQKVDTAERSQIWAAAQVADGDKRPSELLEALDGVCFYRVEDWWTYELCYKKAVRQFHMVRVGQRPPFSRPPWCF